MHLLWKDANTWRRQRMHLSRRRIPLGQQQRCLTSIRHFPLYFKSVSLMYHQKFAAWTCIPRWYHGWLTTGLLRNIKLAFVLLHLSWHTKWSGHQVLQGTRRNWRPTQVASCLVPPLRSCSCKFQLMKLRRSQVATCNLQRTHNDMLLTWYLRFHLPSLFAKRPLSPISGWKS